MKDKPKQSLYQVLSLDVVLGSLAVGLFAVKLLNVNPVPAWWIILPCAVWVVYTLDHLVDGYKRKGDSIIYRHSFHYQNRWVLISLILVIGTLTFVASFFYLKPEILIAGTVLGILVVIYLVLIYLFKSGSKLLQKEFFIALVYVGGIFLAPLVWFGSAPTLEIIIVITILSFLAAAESIMISYFDYENDKNDNLSSFTIYFGITYTRKSLTGMLILLAVAIVISAIVFPKTMLPYFVILLVMDFTLLPVILYPEYFVKNHLFRWIGESVFILPVFIIFF